MVSKNNLPLYMSVLMYEYGFKCSMVISRIKTPDVSPIYILNDCICIKKGYKTQW